MDNNLVKKILTFKSGNFVLSRKCNDGELSLPLLQSRILHETVRDLPILPELSAQIEEELIRRSIFGTAALEGNPLTEERVGQIISEPAKEQKMERAEKEIRNLKNAYDSFVRGWQISETSFTLEEDLIRQIHSLITQDIEHEYNVPGQYRNHLVKVGDAEHGGVYTPPKMLADIETLMREFTQWINSEEVLNLDPVMRAALAHYHFGLIHPFGDGNGRTARLIEALLMRLSGMKYIPIMLSNFYYRNMDDYFWAFSKARKNEEHDVTPFVGFVLKGVVESLNEMKGRIIFFIRNFALRDYYAFLRTGRQITQRQHDLLNIASDGLTPFTLGDLFSISPFNVLYRNVSERTARRDLKKLTDEQLLNVTEGKYQLNLRVLE
jgi:Fic family protein